MQSVVEHGCFQQNFRGMFSHPIPELMPVLLKAIGQQELHRLGSLLSFCCSETEAIFKR